MKINITFFQELCDEKVNLIINDDYATNEQLTDKDMLTLTKKGYQINRKLEDAISEISEEDLKYCKNDYYKKVSKYLNEQMDKINITSFLYKDSDYSKFTFKEKFEKLIQLCEIYMQLSLLCELAGNYLYLDSPTDDYDEVHDNLIKKEKKVKSILSHYKHLITSSLTYDNSDNYLDSDLVDEIEWYTSTLLEVYINSLDVYSANNRLLKKYKKRKETKEGFEYELIKGYNIPVSITNKENRDITRIK